MELISLCLASMASLIRPKTILELGSGRYSSRIFLDKDFFPLVEKVDSFENDQNWSDIVRDLLGNDERFELTCRQGAISKQIESIDLEKYDLIFIDDSVTSEERSKTIQTIASKGPKRPVAVIHDFDHFPYRKASSRFRYSFRFDSMNPHTGVLSNANQLAMKTLSAVNQEIKNHYAVGHGNDDTQLFGELRKFINIINKKSN